MTHQDIELTFQFKTHCKLCGRAWAIRAILLQPDQTGYNLMVKSMIKSLNEESSECCDKELPKIGKEWEIDYSF